MPDTITGYLADPSALARRTGRDETDPDLLDALKVVSDRLTGAIGYPITLVTDEVYWASGDGGPTLSLPAAPIIGTPIIRHEGQPLPGVQIGRRSGVLWRPEGFPDGLENIQVTYSHGYEQIPGDIADAVLTAAETHINLEAGIESVSTGSESIKFGSKVANGGATEQWSDVVARYRLDQNGDGR